MTEISKERAEELEAAWDAATPTERLRMPRLQWLCVGQDTSYFEIKPSELELAAAAEIERLRAIMQELIAAGNEVAGWHRTDRIVANPHEEWRAARDAARAALEGRE